MTVCCTFWPSRGKVKMLRAAKVCVSLDRPRRRRGRERGTHRRLLPTMPIKPSGHSSAEKLHA